MRLPDGLSYAIAALAVDLTIEKQGDEPLDVDEFLRMFDREFRTVARACLHEDH